MKVDSTVVEEFFMAHDTKDDSFIIYFGDDGAPAPIVQITLRRNEAIRLIRLLEEFVYDD